MTMPDTAGAAAIHFVTTAVRGSPAAIKHNHNLRHSTLHPSVTLPSPETHRSSAVADARATAAAVFVVW